MEIYSGEKRRACTTETICRQRHSTPCANLLSVSKALTTPIGGGFRSLNVTLRQVLDLYACVRPVRWIKGTPSPMLRPDQMDIVLYRENTEDVYSGVEWVAGSEGANAIIDFINNTLGKKRSPWISYWNQTGERIRYKTVGPSGDPICYRPQSQQRHPCSQGQYHEVYGRCFQGLGL